MKGRGSGWVWPSTDTCRSLIASSRALCVRGVARLISSASTTLAKIGPGLKVNSCVWLLIEAAAGDVGGEQVGRELDAVEHAGEAAGHRLAHQRLAHPRHVLQEEVFAGQQGHHGEPHHLALAQDDAADVVSKLSDQVFRGYARGHGVIVTDSGQKAEGGGRRAEGKQRMKEEG